MCADAVVCTDSGQEWSEAVPVLCVQAGSMHHLLRGARHSAAACLHTLTRSIQVGVLHNIKHEDMIRKGRVEPGRMFLIDFAAG